jgi:hypothetical protein
MEIWLPILLDLFKWILISVVAIWVVGKITDQYLGMQQSLFLQKQQAERASASFNQKIQAYERLILFLDRVSVPSLIMRLQSQGMTTDMLSSSMLIAIQKELEHNVTQQLYIKENLWQIILLIKDELSAAISSEADNSDNQQLSAFISALMRFHQTRGNTLISKGQKAIKEEASLII